MKYKNKELSEFSLWELEQAKYEFDHAEARRDNASKHPKFNEDRVINNQKIPKMEMAEIANPAYIELKQAIQEEFEKRKSTK